MHAPSELAAVVACFGGDVSCPHVDVLHAALASAMARGTFGAHG